MNHLLQRLRRQSSRPSFDGVAERAAACDQVTRTPATLLLWATASNLNFVVRFSTFSAEDFCYRTHS